MYSYCPLSLVSTYCFSLFLYCLFCLLPLPLRCSDMEAQK